MNRLVLFLLFLFPGVFLRAQMPIFEADSLMRHYNYKMHHVMDRDTALANFYSIDIFGISIYADSLQKTINHPEYRITWQELPIYKNIIASVPRDQAMEMMISKGTRPFPPDVIREYSIAPQFIPVFPTAKLPLKGIRIALDPGHIAFDTAMGRVEDKFILLKTIEGKDSVIVSLAEGILTWNTANILAGQLRAEGAEVFMTRKAANITAFGKTYEQWKKDDYKRTLDSLLVVYPSDIHLLKLKSGKIKDENSIFRYVFRDAELRKRAQLINEFNPDLTIVIHYNVDDANKPWTHSTNKNFCMTFVGGSFQAGELSDAERRYDFLRLLLTDDIEKSTIVCGYAALEFESELMVPLAKKNDAAYLKEHCIPYMYPGVFCRNLFLTRSIQGTLIYGETLYQDNSKECLLLSQKGKFMSEGNAPFIFYGRVNEVAEAYNKAVLDWAKLR